MMNEDEESILYRVLLPPYESTGGIAQTMYCLICGAAIVITDTDVVPAEIHEDYHIGRGER